MLFFCLILRQFFSIVRPLLPSLRGEILLIPYGLTQMSSSQSPSPPSSSEHFVQSLCVVLFISIMINNIQVCFYPYLLGYRSKDCDIYNSVESNMVLQYYLEKLHVEAVQNCPEDAAIEVLSQCIC